MSQKFLTPIDLVKNELQNAVIQNLAAAPSSPVEGQVYYNTTDDILYYRSASTWIGVPVLDATLLSIAALGTAADKMLYTTGVDTWAELATLAYGRSLLNTTNSAALRTLAGLVIGTDVQAQDAELAAIAGLTSAADRLPYFTGLGTASLATFTAFARTFLDDADAAAVRTTLGLIAGGAGDIWVEKAGDTMTGALNMGGFAITNVLDPASAQDAATKAYVDGLVNGVTVHNAVRAATTANITRSAPQTIDGVSVIAGDRVLVKNQTAPAENGIFVVAAGAWTRATDADAWAEIVSAFVFVQEGTTLADTAWVSTADAGGTLNTTAMPWTQFAAPGLITASNQGTGVGVYDTKVGNDLQFRNVKAASSKIVVALVTKDITVDVTESALTHDNIGGTLGIAKGGTGQVTAAAAIVALGGTRKYAASVGNGVLTTFAVNHALNTTDVIVGVKEVAGGLAVVYADVVITDADNVQVTFTVAPTTNQYRVIVMG